MRRNNNVRRVVVPLLLIFFILIIISCILFLWYTLSGNYIRIGNVDDSAENVATVDAANSDIVIVNGIVVGAHNNGKWISSQKFYEANSNKSDIEVKVFGTNTQYGKYKTASIKRHNNSVIYTTLAKEGMLNNYIAIAAKDTNNVLPGMTKLETSKEDEDLVRKAIGSYKLINGSVKITEVYGTNINQVSDKIICATSKKANLLGVYSAVVYVTNNEPYLVKYAYVRDTKQSERWPVFSLQFVMDLNSDLKPEIIIQETTGNDISYSVLELRKDNAFYEVLRTTVEI